MTKFKEIIKYYLIHAIHTPNMCDSIHQNIVISELPELFLLRNLITKGENDDIEIDFDREITYSRYELLRERLNPTNEGYFTLLKRDYSKFIKGE